MADQTVEMPLMRGIVRARPNVCPVSSGALTTPVASIFDRSVTAGLTAGTVRTNEAVPIQVQHLVSLVSSVALTTLVASTFVRSVTADQTVGTDQMSETAAAAGPASLDATVAASISAAAAMDDPTAGMVPTREAASRHPVSWDSSGALTIPVV